MCSPNQDFAVPKAEIEFSFVVHSDYVARVNAGVDLSANTDVMDMTNAAR